MNKILDELKRINSEDIVAVENNKTVQETILLLQAPKEDTSLLEEYGIDHQIKHAKEITNLSDRQKAMTEILDAETYTGKQIQDLCHKYYLKLLPVSWFRGNIPVEFTKELRAFAEKNDIILTGNNYNFFVLAPYDQFTKDRYDDKKDIRRALKIKSSPILFYRESKRADLADVNQVFTKVYSWGKGNFSWLRRYYFLFNGDEHSNAVPPVLRTGLTLLYIIVGILSGIFTDTIEFPVVLFTVAALTIYSNSLFNITSDKLWNRSRETHT